MDKPDKLTLARRIREIAKLKGEFKLRSGAASDVYFDKYCFESDPELLLAIAERMAELVPDDTEVLAGLEMGGIPIATMLSQVTGLPTAFIRKEAKSYGTCQYAEGADLKGKRVALVEDVVSSGGAIVDALEKLHADGVYPDTVVCAIDRQTGGAETVEAKGPEFRALLTMDVIENA